MNRKKMFIVSAVLLSLLMLLIAAGNAFARPGGGFSGKRGMKMLKSLNLNHQQEMAVQDLRLKLQKEMLPLKTNLTKLENDLKLEMTADSFDKNKAEKLVKQISDVRVEMGMAFITHQQDIRSLLNDSQRKKFDMHILSKKRLGKGMYGGGKGERGKHHRMKKFHHDNVQEG